MAVILVLCQRDSPDFIRATTDSPQSSMVITTTRLVRPIPVWHPPGGETRAADCSRNGSLTTPRPPSQPPAPVCPCVTVPPPLTKHGARCAAASDLSPGTSRRQGHGRSPPASDEETSRVRVFLPALAPQPQ